MAKTDNLTIRVEPDLKERAEKMRNKYYKRVPMNIFLEIMVDMGMDLRENIGQYEHSIHKKAMENRVQKYFDENSHESEKGEEATG